MEIASKTIKTTNGELNNVIMPSLHVLGTLKVKDIDTLVNIARFRKQVQDQTKMFSEVHKQICEEDCEKDSAGQPVFDTVQTENGPQQMYRYKDEALSVQMRLRLTQLNEKEVSLEGVTPIKATSLKDVEGITANLIVGLGEFVELD